MNREQATQRTETALEDLARQLQQGHSEQLQAYLDFMVRFHHYSFGNVVLIASQRPRATHWLVFTRGASSDAVWERGKTASPSLRR